MNLLKNNKNNFALFFFKNISLILIFFLTIAVSKAYAGGCTTPPVPTSVGVSDINPWDAQINYTSGGGSTNLIQVQVCTNAAYTTGCSTYNMPPNAPTVRATGLVCNTTYYYRVRGVDTGGSTCPTAWVTGSFTTAPCPPAPTNDNCSNATTMVVGGPQICMSSNGLTSQAGEGSCSVLSGGCTWQTSWYVFQATSAETTITLNVSQTSTYETDMAAFGPYGSQAAALGGCLPTGANMVTNSGWCVEDIDDYDPLRSTSFPTTSGQWYLMQVMNEDCGIGTRDFKGCFRLNNTPSNNAPGASTTIDQCGTVFSGTNIGYSPSIPTGNQALGSANLDGTGGNDVSYVINNDSWFSFCATATGNWSVDFAGISNCLNGSGLQMTIFRGSPTNLTAVWNANSPSYEGTSQTSAAFTVNAGECIYMVVDGFAGDQCNYTYTLNNLTTPCVLLSAELSNIFGVNIDGVNQIVWNTSSEFNTSHFVLEKSLNGQDWSEIGTIAAAGQSENELTYTVYDKSYRKTINYYRLSQYDNDGEMKWSRDVTIDNTDKTKTWVKTVNIMGQEVPSDSKGLVIKIYSDGSSEKVYH